MRLRGGTLTQFDPLRLGASLEVKNLPVYCCVRLPSRALASGSQSCQLVFDLGIRLCRLWSGPSGAGSFWIISGGVSWPCASGNSGSLIALCHDWVEAWRLSALLVHFS